VRLQSKIILLITPVVVVSMVALGAISCSFLRNATVNQAFNSVSMFLARTADHFQSVLAAAFKDVDVIAASSILQQYLLTPDENERYSLLQPPLNRLFSSFRESNPAYYEMRVLLPDGYEDTRVAPPEPANVTEEEGSSPFFQAMHANPHNLFATFFINPDTNRVALLVSRRILLRDLSRESVTAPEQLRGYVALTIDCGFIAEQLRRFKDDYQTSFFLLNRHGRIFYEAGIPELAHVLTPEKLDSLQHSGKDDFTVIDDGHERYFIAGRRFVGDVFLFSVTPQKNLTAASNRLAVFTGIAALAAIAVISLLLLAACRKMIISPVQRLQNAARQFGEGNLDAALFPANTGQHDEIAELSRSFSDMRENLLASQEQIRQLAYYDFLTGLPNRVMFHDFLSRTMARAKRHNEMLALMFVDLDDFKRINDTLGHKLGDELLKNTAQRLTTATRNSDYVFRDFADREPDMVARLGGDEFTILLTYIKERSDPATTARRILEDVSRPIILAGHELSIGLSIGIALFPDDGENADELIKNADIAMYHAKELGKNNYQYFSPSMNAASLERLTLESELRRAVDNQEFFLHYQPQVDAVSLAVVGLEALIRWRHPLRGTIPPAQFIPVAEESGLIVPIGEWVLRQAARQLKTWQQQGRRLVPVSINLSSPQFRHVKIDKLIAGVLEEEEIDPHYLKVELTESILLGAGSEVVRMLRAIKKTGVQICLDDFGTGFSSLNYLKRFPIDVLKIDRSFVMNLAHDTKDAEISAAIIALGKCLNLSIVAEGVEEKEQYDFLRGKGCDAIQGFYFHRPLPPEQAAEFL